MGVLEKVAYSLAKDLDTRVEILENASPPESSLVDRVKVLEDATFIITSTESLFVTYSSYTYFNPVSTFRGFSTRCSYNSESIKALKVKFTLEFAGFNVRCAIRDSSHNIIESTTKYCGLAGSQEKIFVFDTAVTSSRVTGSEIFLSLEVIESTGCRIHPGYMTKSDRVISTELIGNRYLETGSETWLDVGDGFYGAFDVLSESQYRVDYYEPKETQAITNWSRDINLPTKVYATIGHEYNIYFDNLVSDDYKDYIFIVACDQGTQQNERFTVIPTTAGNISLQIDVYDKFWNVVKSNFITLVVSEADSKNGSNPVITFVGDSLTAGGLYTGELLTLCATDVMKVTLQGSRGEDANLHEGFSGYSVDTFMGEYSPFWITTDLDVTEYMNYHSYTSIDWVFIMLGINDVIALTTDTAVDAKCSSNKANLDILINQFKAFNANVKICIMIPTYPCYNQDAFGKSYGTAYNRARFKRNIHRYGVYLIEQYSGLEASNIYVLGSHLNFDTINNMNVETVAVNSRNSTTVVRQSNGVHPDYAGFYQIADSVFYFLKNNA
jgi:lysophospholipase L1-like esterase